MFDASSIGRGPQAYLIADAVASAEQRLGGSWDKQQVHRFALNAVVELMKRSAVASGSFGEIELRPSTEPFELGAIKR
jgi:hypothetical protein